MTRRNRGAGIKGAVEFRGTVAGLPPPSVFLHTSHSGKSTGRGKTGFPMTPVSVKVRGAVR